MDAVRIASIMDDESLKALSAHGVGVGKLSDRLAVHTPADAEKGFTDDFSVDGCVIALKARAPRLLTKLSLYRRTGNRI